MAKNNNLHTARKNKCNEFYTRGFDILQEVQHYTDQFEDKIIYLPCDDAGDELWNVPEDHCLEYQGSQFWYVFAQQFSQYKLKKLICTCYREGGHGVKLTIDRDDLVTAEDKRWPYAKAKRELLIGDGDFRSAECAKFFDECDIVITNPPFSIIDEFVDMIMNHKKQFLIIGPMNAIGYKNIFKYIKEEKMWPGYAYNKSMDFYMPDDYYGDKRDVDGRKIGRVAGICWFTNLNTKVRFEEFLPWKSYVGNEQDYPKYDNFNAIHVDRTANIPKDFDGLIVIPISGLSKINPHQFEIIGEANHGSDNEFDLFKPILNGEEKFKRLVIKWKKNG